jgi:hypothetical protein
VAQDVVLIDVFTGVRSTWDTSTTLKGFVPLGRIFDFYIPEIIYPAMWIKVEDVSNYFGGTEYNSGPEYKKAANVTMTVVGLRSLDWGGLALEIKGRFGWSSTAPAGNWIIPNATKVLSSIPELEVWDLVPNAERINNEDVLFYSFKTAVTYQANRG